MKNNFSSNFFHHTQNKASAFNIILRAIILAAFIIPNNSFAQSATIASPNPAVTASNICAGTLKVPIYYFTIALDATPANLTGFTFTTTGTYAVSDLGVFKLWNNTSNDLSTASQVGINLTPAAAGVQTFAAFTSTLTINATSHFWVTMDVAATPINDGTIAVSAITTSSIITSAGTKSGTANPGDTQTLKISISTNTVTAAQTICTGTTPAALSGSTPTGGNGSYTYSWESSTTSSTLGFAAASGTTTNIGYIPGVLTATTWYRRTVTSAPCSDNVSTPVEITVNPVIAANTVGAAQTICTGSTPTALTGSTPTGGNGSYTYSWESSTTSSTTGFTAASGTATNIGYIPGALTAATWYRRTVTSAPCSNNVSAAIGITVNPVITANTVGTAQTICTGSIPAALTGSTPTGGNGSYSYSWESSTTSSTLGFTAASGTTTNIGYIPGVLTATTWYRRTVTSGPCSDNVSTPVEITVNPVIAANTVGAAQTICTGSTPTALTGSTPTGGNGSYTYSWESSTTSSTTGFTAASGTATNIGYIPGALTAATWYRRTVTSAPCSNNVSAAIGITVNPVITANTVGTAQTICTGGIPAALTGSSPSGGNGSYTYSWQSSTTSSTTGFTAASGTNTNNGYIPGVLTSTTWYRRTVTSAPCSNNVSTAIEITVNPLITANIIGTAQTICTGSTPTALTGSTPSGGNGSYTYSWESSTTSSTLGFTAASGTNTNNGYIPGALTANTWYRRTVTSAPCSNSVSAAIGITVNPVITANSVSTPQTICTGSIPSSLTGSTPSGGNGSYTYSWESSSTSSTTGFTSASGTNNNSGYIPGSLTATTWYRRTVTSAPCASDVSAAIEITVNSIIGGNTVNTAQTICTGSTPAALTGSTPSGGNGTYTYLWQSSTTSSTAGFSAASGTNNNSGYIPGALTATTWYRRTVLSAPCSNNASTAIEITVNAIIGANTASTAQTICTGSTPAALTGSTPTGGNGSYAYSWESSTTSSTAGYTAAPGTNTNIGYIPGVLTATTWYRRTVISGPCSNNVSAAIGITVNPVISNNTVSAPQTICSGAIPAALNGSSPSGGDGSYTYLWESSTTSNTIGFTAAGGTNANNGYIPAALTSTTWFRRTIASGSCTSVSPAIEITVNPGIGGNTINAAQTICTGSIPSALTGSTPTGGDGSYTYSWESSITSSSSGFASATGTNNTIGYIPGVLTATVWYRRTASSGSCTNISAVIEITVNPIIASNSVSTAQTICTGSTPEALTGSIPTGGNGIYTYYWESSTTSSTNGFTAAPGANTDIGYISGILTATTWFRRTVTSAPCSAIVSAAIEILVNPVISNNNISAVQTICTGAVPTLLLGSNPSGGDASYTYLWESSTTGSTSGFAAAAGTNININYAPASLTATAWFRRTVSSGSCVSVSSAIQITVNPGIGNNTVTSAQTICSGTSPAALTGSTPTGGNGFYSYLWESSTVSSSAGFTSASGTNNSIGYTSGTLSAAVWYRRTVTSGTCVDISSSMAITINPLPIAAASSSTQTICSGTSFAAMALSTTNSVSNTSFTWTRNNGTLSTGSVTGIAASGSGNITAAVLTNTTASPVTITFTIIPTGPSPTLCPGTNATATIVVNPTPVLSSSLTPPSICSGTIFSYTPTSTTPGAAFAWTRAAVTGISNLSGNGSLSPNETLTSTSSAPVNVTYLYTVSANNCSNASAYSVVVVVNPTPSLSSSLTSPAICSGTVFSYYPTSTTTGASFVWTRAAITGISNAAGSGTSNLSETLINTTANPIIVTYIYILSANSCTNTTGFSTTVVINPLPADPDFTPYSTAVCSGSQNVSFNLDSIQNNVSYSWSAVNASLATPWGGTPNAVFNFGTISPAVITLQVTNLVTGCIRLHSETITVSGNQAPDPTPISILNINWLICQLNGSGITYQWGYDSIPTMESNIIPGAVFQQYHAVDYPISTKEYWVIVKDGSCFSKSYLNASFLSVNEPINDKWVNIFPNPAASILNISSSEDIIAVKIFEISGKAVIEKRILSSKKNLTVDVKELSNGIYSAEFETAEHHNFFKKLIIQH